MLKKYSVKIPENIKIIHIHNKNLIVFVGPLGRKIVKLKIKILVKKSESLLYVTKDSNEGFFRKQKLFLNSLRGTVTALLKQCVLEVSILLYKKLKLIGIGYKMFLIESNKNSILQFKLGFSHFIYVKINAEMKVLTFKSTNLYLFANSFSHVNQFASIIKSYKYPEPYKGKGILYQNEKVLLKEGKKV